MTKHAAKPDAQLIRLVGPAFIPKSHAFSIPAAFWNEHLCNWLDVAVCGRPSNFLHETVLSIPTTRTILRGAMKKIGFLSATKWAPNFKLFGQIRGQPVLILAKFMLHGKMQIFPLDELIRFNGWSRSAGPLGWIYLGTPGIYQLPAKLHDSKPGQRVTPRTILFNDPQIAMNFRGIRSQSQALLDHSLCTDNWIYPDIRFYRNTRLVPMSIFNSNGKVPVHLIFRKVSEAGLLRAVLKYWHGSSIKPVVRQMMPVAVAIDRARRTLWQAVSHNQKVWQTSPRVRLEAARLQYGYARITYAFVRWSAKHGSFSATQSHSLKQIQTQAQNFLQHLKENVAADQAWINYRQAELAMSKLGRSQAGQRRAIMAAEIAARSNYLKFSNLQYLKYWKIKYEGIAPHDPRHLWIAMIKAEYHCTGARNYEAMCGIAYAASMKQNMPKVMAAAARRYELSLLASRADHEAIRALQVEFQISNDKGFSSKAHIARLEAEKLQIQNEIKRVQAHINLLKGRGPSK